MNSFLQIALYILFIFTYGHPKKKSSIMPNDASSTVISNLWGNNGIPITILYKITNNGRNIVHLYNNNNVPAKYQWIYEQKEYDSINLSSYLCYSKWLWVA